MYIYRLGYALLGYAPFGLLPFFGGRGVVGVTQKNLFSAYKVSTREGKSILDVDLGKYDFCQKMGVAHPRGCGYGWGRK